MIDASKRMVWSFLLDILSVSAIGVSYLCVKYLIQPVERGFYCHDLSLHYPYHHSTITTLLNVILSYCVPLSIIIIYNVIQKIIDTRCSTRALLELLYRDISVFLFGGLTVQLISNVCKKTAGRLRPHFLDVCKPNISFDSGTCGTWDSPVYIRDFTCDGNTDLFPTHNEREHRVAETRLSFLSGHTSVAWYGMVFGAAYLYTKSFQCNKRYSLILGVIQAGMLVYAVVVSITRVTDNKHHPTDVIAGAILGAVIAIAAIVKLNKEQRRRRYSAEVNCHNSDHLNTNEEKL